MSVPEFRAGMEDLIRASFANYESKEVTEARNKAKTEEALNFDDLPRWAQDGFVSLQMELNTERETCALWREENKRLRDAYRESQATIQHLHKIIAKFGELGIRLYM